MLPKGLLHGADFQDWGLGLVEIDRLVASWMGMNWGDDQRAVR